MDQETVCCEQLEHSDFVAFLSISSLALALVFIARKVGEMYQPCCQMLSPSDVIGGKNWMGVRAGRLSELLVCSIRSLL
jgi:hypothetical protein